MELSMFVGLLTYLFVAGSLIFRLVYGVIGSREKSKASHDPHRKALVTVKATSLRNPASPAALPDDR
jgi:hypothetical protein